MFYEAVSKGYNSLRQATHPEPIQHSTQRVFRERRTGKQVSSVCLSQELSVILVIPGWMLKAAAKRPELSGKNTVSNNSDMAELKSMFREVLPKQGPLFVEDITTMVLCKPKLLPLKSLTLEKLEKMHQAAQNTIRQQEMAEKDQQQITH
ncbi:PREDICTED: BBSome-interacting protein 1 isoform X2 [Cercocebus atys]|uniref:BBSome-interacting protein 1 isoform X2 n=1 Tax=Cercocebus atys TaxID=9531 RepID=UPI0005F470BF|nr:PREDICTED: BBSome-interacting protein 1 isoform X2 [Cercocebus atys]